MSANEKVWLVVAIVTMVGTAGYMGYALGLARERIRQRIDQARRNAELAAKPARYELPAAPPTGRTVRDKHGRKWTRRDPGATLLDYGQWGAWTNPDTEHDTPYDWASLLASGAPVFLLPLTEEERALERLYGPVGGRWGNPNEPCPFHVCVLGIRHIPPHIDRHGRAIQPPPLDRNPFPRGVAEVVYCTCHHPEQHRPGCGRYPQLTGHPEETP